MAFQDTWNELLAHVPSLSPFLAQRFVNRAWRELRQRKSWSFLLKEGFLIVPAKITAGTVSATQFSTTITPDATAIAALNAAGTNPPLGRRQFRLSAGERIYNISTWDGATLVLEEPYQEATVSGSSYQVLSVYFRPPSDDFTRFISVRDLVTNYHIRLHYTQEEINRIDPQRNTEGDPLYVVSYKTDTDNIPMFELWPTPSVARSYQVLYQGRGSDMVASSEFPPVIPEQLVLERAKYHAYQWAESAKGGDPKLAGSDWRYLAAEADRRFNELYVKTAREDEDAYMQTMHFAESRSGFMTPVDANYAQNHVVDWM